MKESVQKLCQEAFLYAHECNDKSEQEEGNELTETEFNNIHLTKFAELLIRAVVLEVAQYDESAKEFSMYECGLQIYTKFLDGKSLFRAYRDAT